MKPEIRAQQIFDAFMMIVNDKELAKRLAFLWIEYVVGCTRKARVRIF